MLKLWVWHDVLRDWSAGIAFALAETERQAWEELEKANPVHYEQIREEGVRPVVYFRPIAFTKYGGM